MKITHADSKNRQHTILIDRRDLKVYRSRRWAIHPKGLIDHKTNTLLHRAILGLRTDQYVLFRNGNKFDVRRENLKVITYLEQRQMKKKPFIRTRTGDHPSGVYFVNSVSNRPGGKRYSYRCAAASFCCQGKESQRKVRIVPGNEADAIRQVLRWRVNMILRHGLTPNAELLDMLERITRIARAGARQDDLYGGNAEYADSVIVPSETSFQVIGFNYEAA